MNFRQLVEGSNPKYKSGNEPKFSDKKKQTIADEVNKFVQKNKAYSRDVHYPSETELKGTYGDNKVFTLAITSKDAVLAIYDWFRNNDKFECTEMSNGKLEFKVDNVFLIRLSSGRGFFYSDEGKQKNPKTGQQEMGTIEFLKYYMQNNEYPSNQEINKLVGFDFDNSWYNNFIYQCDAILEFIGGGSYEVSLDSAPRKIGKRIFGMLGKLPNTDGIEKDNWNPADIWSYKNENLVVKTLEACKTLPEFNEAIVQLFKSKDLIGVSLKKQSGKKAAKVIDISKEKPFELDFGSSSINAGVNHCDIMTKGFPKGFFIRSRAKAKSITSEKDIKIYFEGKVEKSSVFLGAIDKKFMGSVTGYDGKPPKTVTYEDVEALFGVLERRGNKVNKTTLKELKDADEMRLKYIFVLYTYVDKIQALPSDTLKKIAMAGYKMNDYSSVHLKVGA